MGFQKGSHFLKFHINRLGKTGLKFCSLLLLLIFIEFNNPDVLFWTAVNNNFSLVFLVVLGLFKSKIGNLFYLAFMYQILKHDYIIKTYTYP